MVEIPVAQIDKEDRDPASLHYPLPFPIRIVAGLIRRIRLRWLLLRHPRLKIGRKTGIWFGDVRFTTKWGEIQIGDECQLISGNLLGRLFIGNRVNVLGAIKLGGSGKYSVTIGDDTWIAPNVYICPSTHKCRERSRTIRQQGLQGGDIRIGSDCWIGVNVVISPGITIGDGAVIGANSVVTKDIPEYAIAVGAPARVIGYRE
ncbi:MAG: acyltransferase [Armatimonadetes bacterium]|nr:acyltransferase [Armatimonadota bacterium]